MDRRDLYAQGKRSNLSGLRPRPDAPVTRRPHRLEIPRSRARHDERYGRELEEPDAHLFGLIVGALRWWGVSI